MSLTRTERIEGGLWGLLIGDALGVPYEFHAPESLPPLGDIEMDPPASFVRSHGMVPPGTWSDDGAQALCLLASLLECERLDVEDFAQRMVRWHRDGYMAVGGMVFDVGVTTAVALRAIDDGTPPLLAARTDEHANGNGALMRVLPLALWHPGSDQELVRDAHLQTRVTHGHPRSSVCSGLYCLWARRVATGRSAYPDAWDEAVAALRDVYRGDAIHREQLEDHVCPDEAPQGQGSGYVVDTLRSACMLCRDHQGFEAVAKAAVALGDDTDTTAAVAGGIAGLRGGVAAIPSRWRRALRGRELVEPLLARWLAE